LFPDSLNGLLTKEWPIFKFKLIGCAHHNSSSHSVFIVRLDVAYATQSKE
jgi:hypothetical protein